MTTTNFLIPIERLTAGVEIEVPGFGSAEVYGLIFEGDSYVVRYCVDDRGGWDALDTMTVQIGGCVEHSYPSPPRFMRSRASVTAEEWEALEEARAKGTAVMDGFERAQMADALGVPAVAAE